MQTLRDSRKLFLAVVAIAAQIVSCALPVVPAEDFDVHLARPWDGDVVMVGEPVELLANGADPGRRVLAVGFFANGRMLGSGRNLALRHPDVTVIIGRIIWTPTEPGLYRIRAVAYADGNYAASDVVDVCVLPFQIAAGHPTDVYAHGYDGDCELPPRRESAPPGEATMLSAAASPPSLTYIPDYIDFCPDKTRFIRFTVEIDDPHDDVVFAAVAVRIIPALSERYNSETTVVLNHIGDDLPYTKRYQGEINIHIFLALSLTDPMTGVGRIGNLTWRAQAFGRDGEVLISAGPFSIESTPVHCDGSYAGPGAPTAPSTLKATVTPLPTQTPASAADCPPGTYFSETTHKCIAIQTLTPKPGGGQQGCSQYGSKDACSAAGCNWDPVNSVCS